MKGAAMTDICAYCSEPIKGREPRGYLGDRVSHGNSHQCIRALRNEIERLGELLADEIAERERIREERDEINQRAVRRAIEHNDELERLREQNGLLLGEIARRSEAHAKRIEELERENRWMAAKIGDKEYDAMREAMRELGGGCRWGRIGGE